MPANRPSVTVNPPSPKTDTAPKANETPKPQDGQKVSDATESKSVDVAQCETRNEGKTRRCQLPTGHPTDPKLPNNGHKFRLAGQKKVAAPLSEILGNDFDLAAAVRDVKPASEGGESVQVNEVIRDKYQLGIDDMVKASHKAWVEAGKPALFNASPRKALEVPPTAEKAVRSMLVSAGAFLKLRVRIAQTVALPSGLVGIYFVGMDRQTKEGDKPEAKTDEKATDEKATDKKAADKKPDSK